MCVCVCVCVCVSVCVCVLTERRMTQLTRTERDAGANRAVNREEDETRRCFGVAVVWKLELGGACEGRGIEQSRLPRPMLFA